MSILKINNIATDFIKKLNKINKDRFRKMKGITTGFGAGTPVFSDYYYNGYAWNNWTDPDNMVDGSELTEAVGGFDASEDTMLNSNTSPGTDQGTITKVEIKVQTLNYSGSSADNFDLSMNYSGPGGASFNLKTLHDTWIDITNDTNAPSPWLWSDVSSMMAYIYAYTSGSPSPTASVAKVWIRVTYIA